MEPACSGRCSCGITASHSAIASIDVVAHVRGVRARVADAVDPVDRVDGAQQLGERARRAVARQLVAVAVDVLAEQGDLAHAVGRRAARPRRRSRSNDAALLASAHRRHDAVGALHVAAHRDLHPRLVRALAARRQLAREGALVADPVEALAVAGDLTDAGALAVGELEVVAQIADAAGAEGDVDPRELAQQVVALRLHQAAADGDHLVAAASPLAALGVLELGVELLVGLLADRAGVEDDDVGVVLVGRRDQPALLQHAADALAVVRVHLAAEGDHVVALGAGSGHADRVPDVAGAGLRTGWCQAGAAATSADSGRSVCVAAASRRDRAAPSGPPPGASRCGA